MAKINQIIAIEKGVKQRAYSTLTNINKVVQKADLFNGFAKNYKRKDEDGEQFPSESKRVQFTAKKVFDEIQKTMSELVDLTARKERSNQNSHADVIIDGEIIAHEAPVTFLLFLEKILIDTRTLISNIPLLDSDEEWEKDLVSGLYRTEPQETHKTKKMQKPIVLYPATDNHPAQTELITEDEIIGFWETVKQSGALPEEEKNILLIRIEKLIKAVKQAREEANSKEETPSEPVADRLFGYIFARETV